MKRKLTILFLLIIFLIPITIRSKGLHFGRISAVKNKVKELKEKREDASDIILSENTKVLSESTLNNLLKVEESTYYFSTAAAEILELQSGDIMLGSRDEGFLRKITSIREENGQFVVETSDATLEEAFKKLNVELKRTLTPSDLKASPELKKAISVVEGQFTVPFSKTFLNDQITASGSITFGAYIDFNIFLDDHEIREVKFISTFTQTIDMTVTSIINEPISEQTTIGSIYEFMPINIELKDVIGKIDIPIIFKPEIKLVAGIFSQNGLDASVHIIQSGTYMSGVVFKNGKYSIIKSTNISFQCDDPTFSRKGDIKGYIGPQLELKILGVVGPYINANGFLELQTEVLPSYLWQLYGGIEVLGGIYASVIGFSLFDYHKTLIEYKKGIASGEIGAGPYELPDTGQEQSYTTTFGEDHDYQAVASQPSYTDNGLTINDNRTGLMWVKDGNSAGCNNGGDLTWEQALTFCEGLSYAGYSDWRLPNRRELMSIVDYGESSPAINTTYFPNTKDCCYWTSTTYVPTTIHAWYVYFRDGSVNDYPKTANYSVRAVRSGP